MRCNQQHCQPLTGDSLDYATVADVRQYLRSAPAGDDALLTALISAASASIDAYCSRTFGVGEWVEDASGRGTPVIYVERGPILAVLALSINGVGVEASRYRASGPLVQLISGWFPAGLNNVSVRYLGGRDVPAAIRDVCVQLVSLRYAERDRVGYTSKSLAGETVSFALTEFPASVVKTLDAYRAVVVPL